MSSQKIFVVVWPKSTLLVHSYVRFNVQRSVYSFIIFFFIIQQIFACSIRHFPFRSLILLKLTCVCDSKVELKTRLSISFYCICLLFTSYLFDSLLSKIFLNIWSFVGRRMFELVTTTISFCSFFGNAFDRKINVMYFH